ncbi:glycosyltransferase family 1 protein [uncultured Bacteroides sp.]|uniref:glycosyltransferase family 4 protein n=1 Tax=uncultured Bacteroides sp. TaxID=162156 RepID=UPI00260C5170|nr:glycosyltransferase family 1 protein [uncultured Bacteroides sp.]
MKVAINASFLVPKGGGIKEYIKNLIINLVEVSDNIELVVYVSLGMGNYARSILPDKIRIVETPYKHGDIISTIKRSIFEQHFWNKEEKKENFDIFHSPFFHSPKMEKAKVIITVHDLRFYRFPKTYGFLRYCFLKYKVPQSVKKASHIIAISDFTKSELIEAYNIPATQITTIHESINKSDFSFKGKKLVDTSDIKIAEKLANKRIILSVGHIEPRKNYKRLIVAFNKVKKEVSDAQLVIVGKKNLDFAEVFRMMNEVPDVHYLDFVSSEMLVWLYANSSLFVFPSIYEGFGFPPLEAATNGVISAVSRISSMPEICGDSVAYFNPYDVDDIAQIILKCLTDNSHRTELKSRLLPNLQRFSWRKNAEETLQLYNVVNED